MLLPRSLLPIAVVASLWAGSAAAFEQFCQIYEDRNYGGHSIKFFADYTFDFRNDTFWNDRVSSVRIGDECELSVYDNPDDTEGIKSIFTDQPDIGDALNDRITSGACHCAD